MVMQARPGQRTGRPPRDDIVRAVGIPAGQYEVRESGDGDSQPHLVGHFAVFNRYTEIDSMWEGHFMERIAPGAFRKTFKENRDRIRVTFNHGHDPTMGDQILGTPEELEEDDTGARYDVPLFEGIPPLLMAGLREGAYGSSFRFRIVREEFVEDPDPSDDNPRGLPERTIKEVELFEFGPVTFPAYADATAGVRSMTDEFVFNRLTQEPAKLADVIDYTRDIAIDANQVTDNVTPSAPSKSGAAPKSTPAPSAAEPNKRKEDKMAVDIDRFRSVETLATRLDEIEERKRYLHEQYAGAEFPSEVQEEWNNLLEEKAAIEARKQHLEERERELVDKAGTPGSGEDGVAREAPRDRDRDRRGVIRTPDNIYDLSAYRAAVSTEQQHTRLVRDGVKRAIETTDFPHPEIDTDLARACVERIMRLDKHGMLGEYLLSVGSPMYRQAFARWGASQGTFALSPQESKAIEDAKTYEERAFTLGSTGLPVPFQLDPTIIPVSNGSVNPFRAISRIVQTTVNEWRGATSAGVTAAYAAEGTEAGDNTPTLAQPAIRAERAQAFVPFSIEVGQDWATIEEEMAREVADAKDDLEATKFTLGTGTNEPQGIIVGATTLVITTTTGAFVIADLYKLEEALPPRFRARAQVLGNRFVFNKIRQFDTSGGSGVWLDGLQPGLATQAPTPGRIGPRVIGYEAFEDSAMDAALTTGSEILVLGDFRYYVIVDRIGMSVDLIPQLVGTNHRPTGQRGLYFFWRNGAEVINPVAFRVLQT